MKKEEVKGRKRNMGERTGNVMLVQEEGRYWQVSVQSTGKTARQEPRKEKTRKHDDDRCLLLYNLPHGTALSCTALLPCLPPEE